MLLVSQFVNCALVIVARYCGVNRVMIMGCSRTCTVESRWDSRAAFLPSVYIILLCN